MPLKTLKVKFLVCLFGGYINSAIAQHSMQEKNDATELVELLLQVDKSSYSLSDEIDVVATIKNRSGRPILVERNIFWSGRMDGMQLRIFNEKGGYLPYQVLTDVPPPPFQDGMPSGLRLYGHFCYGTYNRISTADFFKKPGRYALQVFYKSRLTKGHPESDQLPGIWFDSPTIKSKPVWINIRR